MADRIAVINLGQDPTDRTLLRNYITKPINTFVASFIGTPPMNLIKCNIDMIHGKNCLSRFCQRAGAIYDEDTSREKCFRHDLYRRQT
jgi:ABC-type sugar transport system ATPase subunit